MTGGRVERFCAFCGVSFATVKDWPRSCAGCGETTWRNPLPVAVAIVPVVSNDRVGLLTVRRAIEPHKGELSFPGGFVDLGETWEEAVVRELNEETGFTGEAMDVQLFDVRSAPSGVVLIFGLLPPVTGELSPSTPTDETLGWEVVTEPRELAFSHHTAAMSAFFIRLDRSRCRNPRS